MVKSTISKSVQKTLEVVFPNSVIKEEEYIVYKGQRLFFDFYLPSHNLYVEVQGSQHSQFSSFFHADKKAFSAAKRRDKLKEEWCDLNDYTLVKVEYNEIPISVEKLIERISEAQNG